MKSYFSPLLHPIIKGTLLALLVLVLIDGWVDTVKTTSREDDSTLSFSYHFPAMIFGADLLASWPGFASDRQDAFRRFCRETALPLNTMAQRGCNRAAA